MYSLTFASYDRDFVLMNAAEVYVLIEISHIFGYGRLKRLETCQQKQSGLITIDVFCCY